MNRQVSFALGMSCWIAAAVLGYVAYDAYQTNIERAKPVKDVLQQTPLGRMLPGVAKELEPTTPATTKVCGAIAAGLLAAGFMFLILAATGPRHSPVAQRG